MVICAIWSDTYSTIYKRRAIAMTKLCNYHINCMYSDSQSWANNEDSDETPKNAASHQGLHCLPLIQQFKTQHIVVNCTCLNFRANTVRSWGARILRLKTVQCMIWFYTYHINNSTLKRKLPYDQCKPSRQRLGCAVWSESILVAFKIYGP